VTLGLLTAGCIVPLLIDVVDGGGSARWSWLHLSNPFWTIDHVASRRRVVLQDDVLVALAMPCAVLLVLSLPAIARGVGEVLAASRERRTRAA